jgi:hypothetical protein
MRHNTLLSDIMDEMDPAMLAFIREHITSFTRWDVIRFLYENPNTEDTAESLARFVGRAPHVIAAETQEMQEEGVLEAGTMGERTVYRLTADEDTRKLIADLVDATRDRTFRMKLVYHILRAGGK